MHEIQLNSIEIQLHGTSNDLVSRLFELPFNAIHKPVNSDLQKSGRSMMISTEYSHPDRLQIRQNLPELVESLILSSVFILKLFQCDSRGSKIVTRILRKVKSVLLN